MPRVIVAPPFKTSASASTLDRRSPAVHDSSGVPESFLLQIVYNLQTLIVEHTDLSSSMQWLGPKGVGDYKTRTYGKFLDAGITHH